MFSVVSQVHGGASHTRSAHSLLASQFLLVTDTDADSKVVTCAICMEIFLAVKKAIGEYHLWIVRTGPAG